MKGQGIIVLGALLLACVLGVGIPYYMTAGIREGIPDPRLQIPNTGGSPTPTISTERALTQAEYARLVFSPTPSSTGLPTAFTLSPLPSPLSTFTALVPITGAQSLTPTVTPTLTRRPLFFTSTSQSNPFASPTYTRTATPSRTSTPIPTSTATVTPSRTSTNTPLPTATPSATRTNTPLPTATPVTPSATLPPTATPITPTATSAPPPTATNTSPPPPTQTPEPPTPVPPTETPEPPPTETETSDTPETP